MSPTAQILGPVLGWERGCDDDWSLGAGRYARDSADVDTLELIFQS